MKRALRFFAVILFGVFCVGVSGMAEEITLTTYYPAPYGAYEDLDVSGDLTVGGDLVLTGNLNCDRKGTFLGGIDPPYISFSSESHESIRERAKDVEEHEKVMQFWNSEEHRLELYVIEEDRFYTITGDLIEE